MAPCRLIALQSVSVAPGTSTEIKASVSAKPLGAFRVRKTRTVKQVSSNKLVLCFRMWPPEVCGESCYASLSSGVNRETSGPGRASHSGQTVVCTTCQLPISSVLHPRVHEQYSQQRIGRHRKALGSDPSNKVDCLFQRIPDSFRA